MNNKRIQRQIVIITLFGCTTWGLAQTNPPTRLPEVTVVGTNALREEAPLGPNQQPEWTARRRFGTTRIYVHPPWQIETETSWDGTYPRHGSPSHELTQEFEMGLPYRFQVDYEYHEAVNKGRWRYNASSFELRWALADWGKLPLNPTLKVEYHLNNGFADDAEFVLQLGDELAPRWHWGADLYYGNQFGDDREREYAASFAISYTLIDEKLGAGVEMKFSSESDKDTRNDPQNTFLIGPSVQWRTTRRTHLDIVPLFGIGHEAPQAEVFVFFGVEFGPGSKEKEGLIPASLRHR
jgi:hypothetical protein